MYIDLSLIQAVSCHLSLTDGYGKLLLLVILQLEPSLLRILLINVVTIIISNLFLITMTFRRSHSCVLRPLEYASNFTNPNSLGLTPCSDLRRFCVIEGHENSRVMLVQIVLYTFIFSLFIVDIVSHQNQGPYSLCLALCLFGPVSLVLKL